MDVGFFEIVAAIVLGAVILTIFIKVINDISDGKYSSEWCQDYKDTVLKRAENINKIRERKRLTELYCNQ